MDSESVHESILPPIDFQQNEMEIVYPFDTNPQLEEDINYLPPEEQVLIQTKAQAKKRFLQVYREVLESVANSVPHVIKGETSTRDR
ncbi:hypothetical protein RB195_023944 [Necator americanus]